MKFLARLISFFVFSFSFFLSFQVSLLSQERVPSPLLKKKEEVKEPEKLKTAKPIHPDWQLWLKKYASNSPYLTHRKLRPSGFSPTDVQLQKVLNGQSAVEFPTPLIFENTELTQFDLTRLTDALRFEAHDQIDLQLFESDMKKDRMLKELSRFRIMRTNSQEMIKSRKEEELIIMIGGATHAFDLFFSFFLDPDRLPADPLYVLKTQTHYAGGVADLKTPFFTPEYYRFKKAFRGTEIEKRFLGSFGVIDFTMGLSRLYYYRGLSSKIVQLSDLVTESQNELGAIYVMDIHNLQIPKIYEDLPEAKALLSMGFRKIRLGIEGWKFGQSYEIEDLKAFYRLGNETYFGSASDLEYYKKFRPAAFRMLEKGVVIDQTWLSLEKKLKSYQSRGIMIEITGLEDFDRISAQKP